MTNSRTLRWLRRHRIAVLKGGWSRERSISLKTGTAMEASLRRLGIRYRAIDVQSNIADVLRRKKIQFAFIGLHGAFGEDGQVQHLLDRLGILYTGSGAVSSSVAMDKTVSRELFRAAGLRIPDGFAFSAADFRRHKKYWLGKVRRCLKKGPVFIKPSDQGSAIGAARVDRPDLISSALRRCFRAGNEALVERFIPGCELTVGVLGRRALPVIEIQPVHNFYDFHSKYAKGGSRHLIPAPLSPRETGRIQSHALRAFSALNGRVYGRVDFIRSKKGRFFILEVNTIPGMTETSLLPEAAASSGMNFDRMLLRIAALSIKAGMKKR